jgi:hypothetical protein
MRLPGFRLAINEALTGRVASGMHDAGFPAAPVANIL